MARITIEDCLDRVDNRFQLIHLAAKRVRQLKKGAPPLVVCKNKDIVVALREIAAGNVFPMTGKGTAPGRIEAPAEAEPFSSLEEGAFAEERRAFQDLEMEWTQRAADGRERDMGDDSDSDEDMDVDDGFDALGLEFDESEEDLEDK